jgi:uncharacterized protein (TIGR03118 family)
MVVASALTACGGDAQQGTTGFSTIQVEGAQSQVLLKVKRTDVVSDQPGALQTDPNLVNAWGLAFHPAGFASVSDNGTGKVSQYNADGTLKLTIVVPKAPGADTSSPTGQVFNGDRHAFDGDTFVIVTEDGTISGWQRSAGATLRFDGSGNGAVYKGVTIAPSRTDGTPARLYAANFHAATVDVFDDNYAPVHQGGFVDSDLPQGFAPFNVMADPNGGDRILVTYALQDNAKHDDVKGPGHGFVDVFDGSGRLLNRLISGGNLNSPWGLALATVPVARLGRQLLVGNFGDGRINVFSTNDELTQARLEGVLGDSSGAPLVIDGLWAIAFPPEAGGFHRDELWFTAGPDGERHGRFGFLQAISVDSGI